VCCVDSINHIQYWIYLCVYEFVKRNATNTSNTTNTEQVTNLYQLIIKKKNILKQISLKPFDEVIDKFASTKARKICIQYKVINYNL